MKAMSENKPLTPRQEDMLSKVNNFGFIKWAYTTPQETRLLNSLVKKGYISWNKIDRTWRKL